MGLTRPQFHRWLALSAIVFALGAVLSLTYPIEELSRRLSDFYFRLRGTQPTSQQVALVLIDDASISRYGRWPWSRVLLARLVRAASAPGPRALGLDIILSEPQEEAADRDLAEALGSAGNVVLATKIAASPEHSVWAEPLPLFALRAAGVGRPSCVGAGLHLPQRDGTRSDPWRATMGAGAGGCPRGARLGPGSP